MVAWNERYWGPFLENVPLDQLGRTDMVQRGLAGCDNLPAGAPHFTQPAMVPPIPEPSTALLGLLEGGLLLAGRLLRRRGTSLSLHVGSYTSVANGLAGLHVIDVCSPVNWCDFSLLMVNAQGVVIGFSGSSCSSYVGAYYCWRHGAGTTMEGPVLLKAGEDHFPETRWGIYSYTCLDPEEPDGLTFWKVQEYARPSPNPAYLGWWGTWAARIVTSD